MKIKVHVTKEILHRSKMCGIDTLFSIDSCAIALAVRDIFPAAQVMRYIEPFGAYGRASKDAIDLPGEALHFIDAFDSSKPEQRAAMPPISFDIEVPDSVIERIGLQELETILSKSVNLELVDRH